MGFNIQVMFDELFEIIASAEISKQKSAKTLIQLIKCIQKNYKYAQECDRVN